MRYVLWVSAAVAALSVTVPAQAMPASPIDSGETLTLVRDGCGPFGRRSHYGYCKDSRNPEITYEPGEQPRGGGYRDNGYGGGYGGRPRFYEEDYQPRCFMRETYDGPVRICR